MLKSLDDLGQRTGRDSFVSLPAFAEEAFQKRHLEKPVGWKWADLKMT
jgi:hypothetical protein